MRKTELFTEITCSLLILLFVYAAASKLMDFQKFRVQLGQSPLLTSFSWWVAWIIPLVEILVSLLLAFPGYRLAGLLASFSLLSMFSMYIIAITRFSEFVPCSCGGILQNMTWNQHLLFNLVFVALAATAILLCPPQPIKVKKPSFRYT